MSRPAPHHAAPHRRGQLLFALLILYLAFNMRGPITGIGVLATQIREELSLSAAAAGLLTSLPLFSFAVFSIFVPAVSLRSGTGRTMLLGGALLLIGLLMRSLLGAAGLFAGMLLVGMGICVFNVMVPAIIKENFLLQMGLMTGLYNVSLSLSSALASAVSVPLAERFGWPASLGLWIILAALALLLWLAHMAASRRGGALHAAGELPPPPAAASRKPSLVSLLRHSLAWQVALCMGLQSFIWYSLSAWLPTIYQSKGLSPEAAGYMGTLLQLFCLPSSIAAPVLAARLKNQRVLSAACYSLYVLGALSLLFAPAGLPLYGATVIVGLACGTGVPMAISFITLRSSSVAQATRLSGLSQTLGYSLAAVGPTVMGAVHDFSGGWTLPLCIIAGFGLLLILFGQLAGRDLKIPE